MFQKKVRRIDCSLVIAFALAYSGRAFIHVDVRSRKKPSRGTMREAELPKRAKRGGAGSARKVRHAQSTSVSGGPVVPPALAIFVWLLDPERRETMRRRFIDGKGGPLERWIWKFAYSKPLAPEDGIVGMRFMTVDQYFRGEGAKPGPKYLNLPPGAVDRSGRPDGEAGISWERLALQLHQAAWALVQDPEYVDALRRRIGDGKAPAMERLLCEITEENSRKPEAWRPKKPVAFVSEVPPWLMDPWAEREKAMLERQADDEKQEALARQEAPDKQTATTAAPPDEPADLDDPVLYTRES
jgi:hypothetical protein